MPLGDPMGGETPYIEVGRVERVWMSALPVRHLGRAIDFYVDVVGLGLVVDARDRNWAEVGGEEPTAKIGLYVPAEGDARQPGGPSGIVLEVDSLFEFHRRLVDEEVPFPLKPVRRGFGGLMAIFLDCDGNEVTAVEDPDHYQRYPRPDRPRREARPEGPRSCRRPASAP